MFYFWHMVNKELGGWSDRNIAKNPYRDFKWSSFPRWGVNVPSNDSPFRSLQETTRSQKILWAQNIQHCIPLNPNGSFLQTSRTATCITLENLKGRKPRKLTAFALYHQHNEHPTTCKDWNHLDSNSAEHHEDQKLF